MAKTRQVFFCKECGQESAKWMGQCPSCNNWNSFVEERITVGASKHSSIRESIAPTSILEVKTSSESRVTTRIKELDRVLGGGIVKGSLVLVGGDPGIGKSTLLLQMCKELVASNNRVLYISGEESLSQIKMRGERLGTFNKEMLLLCDNSMNNIENAIIKSDAQIIIIDSIQTMIVEEIGTAPGTVTQVREVTAKLMQLSKHNNISIFIVGHVTKEGTVAGPRTLEHMVDCVLYFEGDRNAGFRILRGVKNRFGSTNEIGVFKMSSTGLWEVENPSSVMLSGRPENVPGSVVVCSIEGTRPILIELQALVCHTNFNMPRRTSVGLDYNRVNLLMAVLEKRGGYNLAGHDAYVNIAGGLKVNDPALDLAIICALVSSFKNITISSDIIIFGEVGLAGEVRGVTSAVERVKEAAKLGFNKCIIPKSNIDDTIKKLGIIVMGVSYIEDALEIIG